MQRNQAYSISSRRGLTWALPVGAVSGVCLSSDLHDIADLEQGESSLAYSGILLK